MNSPLFPESLRVLDEAYARHPIVWTCVHEAIDLAHIAYCRRRDIEAPLVPGVPSTRRARNEINDDVWRFFRMIADPLVEQGLVRRFDSADGGDFMVLPDGLIARIKKGAPPDGVTSNYPTEAIQRRRATSDAALFSEVSPLEDAIMNGVTFDCVYVSGRSLGEYSRVGLRLGASETSPLCVIDPTSTTKLASLAPEAAQQIAECRKRLAS